MGCMVQVFQEAHAVRCEGVCKDVWAEEVDAASGSFQGQLFSHLFSGLPCDSRVQRPALHMPGPFLVLSVFIRCS